jgi:hypothetical protein
VAAEDYAAWAPLPTRFESTGGGGIIIDGYEPVVVGDRCVTPFSAIEPNGRVHRNIAAFRAVETQGGILCTDGQWAAVDGSGAGTTPLRVFIRDGVRRRSP